MANDSKITELGAPVITPSSAKIAPRGTLITKGFDAQLSGVTKNINIFAAEHEGGEFAVLVGVNEVMYQIPRGVDVQVPEEVLQVLNNAVFNITIPVAGGGVKTRNVPRYNVQVLS